MLTARAGIVSAPLWDSRHSTFAGLLTSTDYINVIQYYRQFPDRLSEIEKFRLSGLRGMEPHPWPSEARTLLYADLGSPFQTLSGPLAPVPSRPSRSTLCDPFTRLAGGCLRRGRAVFLS